MIEILLISRLLIIVHLLIILIQMLISLAIKLAVKYICKIFHIEGKALIVANVLLPDAPVIVAVPSAQTGALIPKLKTEANNIVVRTAPIQGTRRTAELPLLCALAISETTT